MNDPKSKSITNTDQSTDVTNQERNLLDESMENSSTDDNDNLRRSKIDDKDEDGTPLNEGGGNHVSGDDLDIPGADLDDDDEAIGEEDEENNSYSEADTE